MNCTCVYKICRHYICGKSSAVKMARQPRSVLPISWGAASVAALLDLTTRIRRLKSGAQAAPRETRYITSTAGLICPCKVPHVKQLEAPAMLFTRRIKTFCSSAETEIMTPPPVSSSHHSNISARAQTQIKRIHVLAFLFKYFNSCKTPVSHWGNVEK